MSDNLSIRNELSIRVSGQNGDGIFSIGEVLSKLCSRSGLNVHGSRAYQSIIRGGHVSYSIRVANHEVKAPADYIDVLLAIRGDSFVVDAMPMMKAGGVVIYDATGFRIKDPQVPEGVMLIDFPAVQMARDIEASVKILYNTVFAGATVAIYDLDLDLLKGMLGDIFQRKGDRVVQMNHDAADAGYNWFKEHCEQIPHNLTFDKTKNQVYIGGNEALAYGMLNGGLQSFSYYPMTPATPVGIFLSEYGPETGCVVKQMEDEINVANYAVGAAYAGARSGCATSGGGFALMTEAIGFASMIESPVVFIEVARSGPSTGLPTKTEQGDLNQLLGASQGDFPRAIIAAEGVEDSFYLGQEALNIADEYQMPVLIASDLYLGEHFETIKELDYQRIPIKRGKFITDDIPENERPYQRYKLTEDGISPRVIPGVVGGSHDAGSDEHDESGELVSDRRAGYPEAIHVRKQQMEKRMKKMDVLLENLPKPVVAGHSADDANILIVSWGSSRDLVTEVMKVAVKKGIKAANLNIKYILPFQSKEVGEILNNYKDKGVKVLLFEGNYTGQMGKHITGETGFQFKNKYLRYDGEYILPRDLLEAVEDCVHNGGLN
ncbi:MAG: 2-oxoglutarate synthase subunit KorA [Candidatus Heimdallarchaeota archaeon LC_2]|nr:MAG: 2-oxoglutarate synthase subunit KorA [Candidatus Heimdallarchaeota archaeon LC_2]